MKFFIILFLIQSSFLFGDNRKEIEIVYMAMPTRSKLMLENIVEKYNDKQKKVKVKVRIIDSNAIKKVADEIEEGLGPDGFVMSDVLVRNAVANCWIQPLDKYLYGDETKYIPKSFIVNNKKYGYYTGSKGAALYYNKKILEKYSIPKPKKPSEIPYLTRLAKDKGVIPVVNDTNYSSLKYGAIDYLTKYHLYMEEQKLFVYSEELGYANKYEAFFSGKVAFIVGSIDDVNYSDFYRNIYGMIPLVEIIDDVKHNVFTLAYVLGKNAKYPNETLNFFRYMYKVTNEYDNYLKGVI